MEAEHLDVGDGLRMKWSLENAERLITGDQAIEVGKSIDERRERRAEW